MQKMESHFLHTFFNVRDSVAYFEFGAINLFSCLKIGMDNYLNIKENNWFELLNYCFFKNTNKYCSKSCF